jgi:hypothetical protein
MFLIFQPKNEIGAVKKSATKPVDFLDMEVHGL